jgi:hypothetical protein
MNTTGTKSGATSSFTPVKNSKSSTRFVLGASLKRTARACACLLLIFHPEKRYNVAGVIRDFGSHLSLVARRLELVRADAVPVARGS